MIITIVTPTLNARRYLRECIESARGGATRDIEVEHVIVDGGSTDGTVELAQSYGLRVMTGKDRGIFDAINKGSFQSSGELLGFLGADDVLLEHGLETIVRAYRESQRRWVVGGIQWIGEHGESLGGLAAPPTWLPLRGYVCLDWNPIMHMATYFSREFYSELGGFNVDYKDAGDFEMFSRALSKAPYARVAQRIACFRRTGHNNSAVNTVRQAREVQAVRDAYGPRSPLEQTCWRYGQKAWFNLTNPQWLFSKVSSAVRVRLRLQEEKYF